MSLALVALGLTLTIIIPLSKDRASVSYVLLNLGLSGLVFYGFHLLHEYLHLKLPILTDWRRNPLLLYLLHYVFLGIFALPAIPEWYMQAPLWLVVLQLSTLIGVLSWGGHYLNKRKLYFAL